MKMLPKPKDGEYYFAIVLKENGKVIGEIDAMPEATDPSVENAVRDTFSPCWMLNPKYHGEGYAYEAATPSLIICSIRKVQGVYMPLPRITMCRAKSFVKSLVCAVRGCSVNS